MKRSMLFILACILTSFTGFATTGKSTASQLASQARNASGATMRSLPESQQAVHQAYALEQGFDQTVISTTPWEKKEVISIESSEKHPGKWNFNMPGDLTFVAGSQKAPSRRGAGKAVPGKFISKDLNINGVQLGAVLTVSATAHPDTVTIANIYEWGNDCIIKMGVNATEGTFEIPAQKIDELGAYGDVMVLAIRINEDGSVSIPKDRTIRGTINEKGEATFQPWGVVALNDTKATALNLFESSQWVIPNATMAATDVQTSNKYNIPLYIEQTSPNEVIIYDIVPGMTATVSARLTPFGQVILSPQKVADHATYGPFYLYNITDAGKVDTTNPIVATPSKDGSLSIPGYMVAAQQTNYVVMVSLKDITITGTYNITFPTPIKVSFEGEGSASAPYLIKSYSDLQALSQSVEQGNTYLGKYFALASDLDLSQVPVTEYIPIGNSAYPFSATFDGRGHTISGLRIDGKGYPYIGIFGWIGSKGKVTNLKLNRFMAIGSGAEIGCLTGRNEGVIENITVTNSILQTHGLLTGGICGASLNGTIRNSSFHGQLDGMGSVAGIVGQASGSEVTGCTVSGQLTLSGFIGTSARDLAGIAGVFTSGTMKDCLVSGILSDTYGRGAVGGIAGRSLGKSTYSNCLNSAAISGRSASAETDTYIGGIFGLTSSATINDCQNAGSIIASGTCKYVGGLAGQLSIAYSHVGDKVTMDNKSIFTNCMSTGQIISSSDYEHKGLMGYAFHEDGFPELPEDVCFINCFFDQQISFYNSDKFGRNTKDILGSVPAGYSPELWSVNNGEYPVLKAYASTYAGRLAASAISLKDGNSANKVKGSFNLVTPAGVKWSVGGASGQTETDAVSMSGSTVTIKNNYASEILSAETEDGMATKLYMLKVVPKIFDGEGTKESPYLLKAAADFIKLDDALNKFLQPHAGDHFALTNDIDFKDTPDFKGLGFGALINSGFGGELDGKNFTIHNLSIPAATYTADNVYDSKCPNGYNGFLNMLLPTGAIRNLNIASDCKFDFNIYSGPFVGFNRGTIENCRNYADITGHIQYIGGIAGVNHNGVIVNCYNEGDVTGGKYGVGGIAGWNYDEGTISGCQNNGTIQTKTIDDANANASKYNVGGIAGDNYGIIEDCANGGLIISDSYVGGIAGKVTGYYIVMNPNNPQKPIEVDCYGIVRRSISTGQVVCNTAEPTRGALIGTKDSSKEIASNYFDGSVNLIGGIRSNNVDGTISLSTSELTSGTPLEGLKSELFDFTAKKYPVLKQFANEEGSKALRSIFINFAPKQIRTNITVDTDLSEAEGLTWKLNNATGFNVVGSKLTVKTPEGMTILGDTLTASIGDAWSKVYELSSIPVIFTGSGSLESPFLIENKGDWAKLGGFVEETGWSFANSHFKITQDIDFGGDSILVIAHSGKLFQGDMDGNGKTLSNFVYDNAIGYERNIVAGEGYQYVGKETGLFGSIGNEGVVRNLTINGSFKGHSSIGGIAGHCYGRIENCHNRGFVGTNSSTNCGGIAYKLWENGVISGCNNYGTVSPDNGKDQGNTGAAGIVYMTTASSLVENCRNLGTVGHENKTMNYGIAATVGGVIRDCHNEKPLLGTGTLCGIAGSLTAGAIMEDCSNTADFDLSKLTTGGGNIYGIFNSATAGDGYIRNCWNSGNITTLGQCAGIGGTSNVSMIDCYNTGDITVVAPKTARAVGVVHDLKGTTATRPVSSGLYNTGNIKSGSGNTAGIVATLAAYHTLKDSYNTGDIDQRSNALCCAGVAAASDGRLERCYNLGNVTSRGACTGGVAGRPGSDKTDMEMGVFDCFNMGNIHVRDSLTSTSIYGTVGGVIGSPINGALSIANCVNTGKVSVVDITKKQAKICASGIIGNILNANIKVSNCYNTGIVEAPEKSAKILISYTIGSNDPKLYLKPDSIPFDRNLTDIWYDKTICTGTADRSIEGSGLTSSQLAEKEIPGFRKSAHGGYPILDAFEDNHDVAALSTVMLRLKDESTEDHGEINNTIELLSPDGYIWSETGKNPCFVINGKTATPSALGETVLTCTSPEGWKRHFALNVKRIDGSGIGEIDVKEIKSIEYIDMQGRKVISPEAGAVYIVRTNYTDGTVKVERIIR